MQDEYFNVSASIIGRGKGEVASSQYGIETW